MKEQEGANVSPEEHASRKRWSEVMDQVVASREKIGDFVAVYGEKTEGKDTRAVVFVDPVSDRVPGALQQTYFVAITVDGPFRLQLQGAVAAYAPERSPVAKKIWSDADTITFPSDRVIP